MKILAKTVVVSAGMLAPNLVSAQESVVMKELEVATRECTLANEVRPIEVCSFDVLVEFSRRTELRSELGPWLPYMMMAGSIRAALASSPKDAVVRLEAAIEMFGDVYADRPELSLWSTPLHLYRAEACEAIKDSECFMESAAVLLEREVAIRKAWPFSPPLQPPYRWSKIGSLPSDTPYGSPYRWPDDLSEMAENDPKGHDFDARINAVLTEAERRLQ